jgi:hypothetical protein
MQEESLPADAARPTSRSDVDPLVWGIWAGGALSTVVVLTLLVSNRFTGRGLLLVFAVPLVVLAVVVVARRLRPDRRDAADPVADERSGGGD